MRFAGSSAELVPGLSRFGFRNWEKMRRCMARSLRV